MAKPALAAPEPAVRLYCRFPCPLLISTRSGRYCRIATPSCLSIAIVGLVPERIVGIKNVTVNEPLFKWAFPGISGHARRHDRGSHGADGGRCWCSRASPDRDNKLVLLVSIEAAKFRRPVVPGDQLRIEMTVIRRKGSVAKMAGRATVDGLLVAEAEVMCKLQDKVLHTEQPRSRDNSRCRFIPQRSSIRRRVSTTAPISALTASLALRSFGLARARGSWRTSISRPHNH